MSRPMRYPKELRERAVRLVLEHRDECHSQWEAMRSVQAKLGIGSPETVRKWVRQAEVEGGARPAAATDDLARVRELEREVRDLRRVNEILKSAASLFAREFEPRPPR